jgi:hypothetical protein
MVNNEGPLDHHNKGKVVGKKVTTPFSDMGGATGRGPGPPPDSKKTSNLSTVHTVVAHPNFFSLFWPTSGDTVALPCSVTIKQTRQAHVGHIFVDSAFTKSIACVSINVVWNQIKLKIH